MVRRGGLLRGYDGVVALEFLYLETTIAGSFLRSIGFVAILAVIFAVKIFDMTGMAALSEIFKYFVIFAVISVVIIFQPELRHGITRLGRSPFARTLRRLGVKAPESGQGPPNNLDLDDSINL